MVKQEGATADGAGVGSGLGARLRRARSASAATGSAGVFVVAAALLSFVPDTPTERGSAWALRGTLPGAPLVETGLDRAHRPAALQRGAKSA